VFLGVELANSIASTSCERSLAFATVTGTP
jgi:hypothetical protein